MNPNAISMITLKFSISIVGWGTRGAQIPISSYVSHFQSYFKERGREKEAGANKIKMRRNIRANIKPVHSKRDDACTNAYWYKQDARRVNHCFARLLDDSYSCVNTHQQKGKGN